MECDNRDVLKRLSRLQLSKKNKKSNNFTNSVSLHTNMNNTRYIFTVTTGRSGAMTLANILNSSMDNAYASFEAPYINTIFKGSLSNIEYKVRRKYIESNELLGRGKVLKAYDDKNISFINDVASKRIKTINKRLVSENKSIYIDVSKYFARGLHVGFCNMLPQISIINLVRERESDFEREW